MAYDAMAQAAVNRLYRQMSMMISLGVTTTQVIDSAPIRSVQLDLGNNQVRDNTPIIQHYGFASNLPVGTNVVLGCVSGDRSNAAVLASSNNAYKIENMGNGSVALYDMFGNTVVLSSTGIAITSATNLTLNAENIVIHATQSLKYDADGNGTEFTASTRDDYVTGSTNTSHNLSPPQVP